MPIPKSQAGKVLNKDDELLVKEIIGMLDARITSNPDDVHVWKQDWSPSLNVLNELKRIYEAPGMGWKFSTQPDRDGVIIWLK